MTRQHITSLIEELTQIRKACLSMEKEFAAEVDSAAEGYRASARNLLHYLGLRQHDIRRLQQDLWTLGLSSLARTEAHVLAGADAILVALHALAISDVPKGRQAQQPVTFETGPALLEQHTTLLLGPEPDHKTRVMVTMPTEAGDDYRLIRDLLAAGMDLMRISCAHDSPDAWRRMISNLEAAQHEVDRPCKVLMDLCGPELRTGELGGSSRLVHWKVRKNPRGEVIAPARIRVVAATGKPLEADATPELPVGAELLAAAKTGDYFQLELSPSQRRNLRVAHKNGSLCWAETGHSGYAEPGMPITLMRNGEGVIARGVVGEVPWLEEPVLVFRGEFLVVTGPRRRQATRESVTGRVRSKRGFLARCLKYSNLSKKDIASFSMKGGLKASSWKPVRTSWWWRLRAPIGTARNCDPAKAFTCRTPTCTWAHSTGKI